MAQRLTQSLRPAQRLGQRQALSMTPQLAQSIKLLAMSQNDLDDFVGAEAARNPFLMVRGRSTQTRPSPPRSPSHALSDGRVEDVWERIVSPTSLVDHLCDQIALSGVPVAVATAARLIASDLDPAGFLPEPARLAKQLGLPRQDFLAAFRLLRSLDPIGVGARDLSDCLSLQLAARDRLDPAMRAVVANLPLVAAADRRGLREVSGLDDTDLDDALAELRDLDPRPGARFEVAPPVPAPPDVVVRADTRGAWLVELNPDTLPRVLVDEEYHATIALGLRTEMDRDFAAVAMRDANWLVRALDQRARTSLKVARAIVSLQDAFLTDGIRALAPLTMQTVADAVGMHESTVSRVVANKTVLTPRGLLPLRFFFTTAIAGSHGGEHSAAAVKDRIRTIVADEGVAVMSDDAIVARLRSDGVEIARRTVAKYRDALAIPSSLQRRRRLAFARSDSGRIAAGAAV